MKKTIVTLLLAAAVVVFVAGYARTRASSVRQLPENLPFLGPSKWVPFSADVRTVHASQPDLVVKGHFVRGADGSTRTEDYPPNDSEPIVSIHNVTTRTSYYHVPRSQKSYWVSTPLSPAFRTEPQEAIPAIRGAQRELEATPEGLQVFRYLGPGDYVALTAPSLNFFSVLREDKSRRMEFVNIKVGAPAAGLFEPPAGADVRPAKSVQEAYNPPTPIIPEQGKSHAPPVGH